MEPFTRIMAVQSMNQEDSQCEATGNAHFDIFTRSPVRQTRSYPRLKSKNVAIVRGRWVD